MSAIVTPWDGWPDCPCGCGEQGLKLQARHDRHLIGCKCRPCLGRRSKKKGRAAQARGYRALGGTLPWSPGHEENQGVLSIEVSLESKSGAQVPRQLVRFAESEWARRAWDQADRAIPVGMSAYPSVYCEPGGGWAILVTLIQAPRGKAARKEAAS